MTYTALVAPLRDMRKHNNADRLMVGTAAGYQVIVSNDHREGDMGLVFPEEGQISPSLAMHASLYRKHPVTGEALGGYLDDNGRVKTLKLRGEESRGLWLPLELLEGLTPWVPEGMELSLESHWDIEYPKNLTNLRPGLTQESGRVDGVGGIPLCRKFLTKATRRALGKAQVQGTPKERGAQDRAIKRHYDTNQLRETTLPMGTTYVTLKMHGTSGRTGNVKVENRLNWAKKLWNYVSPSVVHFPAHTYMVTSGTRKTAPITPGTSDTYRWHIHQGIESLQLARGETWFYEIVGYKGLDTPTPIMGSHDPSKYPEDLRKTVKKRYGDKPMVFSYGCAKGQYAAFVYRVVRDGRELTYTEMANHVAIKGAYLDLRGFPGLRGVYVVPLVNVQQPSSGDMEQFDEMTRWANHALEQENLREGIVVHVESCGERITKGVKHKGYEFCVAEGIKANDQNFVDPEIVA